MTITYTDLAQFQVGSETASLYATDASEAVSLANVTFGPVGYKDAQMLSSIGLEPRGLVVVIPKASIGSAALKRGQSRIDRTNGESWRIQSADYSHVFETYRCVCSEARQ